MWWSCPDPAIANYWKRRCARQVFQIKQARGWADKRLQCQLVAQMRSADRVQKCLLFGVDRTCRGHHETDANDPMQTYVGDGRLAALRSASPHEFYDALAGIRAGIIREFALEGGGEREAVHPCSLAGGDDGAHRSVFMLDHPATLSHSADPGCRSPR